MQMSQIIKMLLDKEVIDKKAVYTLVRMRPPKDVTFLNFVKEGLIDIEKVERAIADFIKAGHFSLVDIEDFEGLDSRRIAQYLSEKSSVPFIDLENKEIDISLFNRVPFNHLAKHTMIPIEETDLNVIVGMANLNDIQGEEVVQRSFPKKPVKKVLVVPAEVRKKLQQLEVNQSVKGILEQIRRDLENMGGGGAIEEEEGGSAVLRLIEIILKQSIYRGASDIHIEAAEKNCVVRERIDGMLQQGFIFDRFMFAPLSSRLKLLSGLDIAEKRKPQDGRFSYTIGDKEYDFRVSTLPTIIGESIVLRILDKSKAMIRLEDAGMSRFCYERFSEAIKAPYGIVLVTGPTGSGKTTTLYGALNAIKDIKDKIITVEDPVEYQMAGLQQVNVKKEIGLGFADALRSILRQDPDKIMIGEIRDTETLRIAIQAALTGHLVLSTLHTNDAISAISRMLDMGIETYLVSGALVAIQAQRLVRKICPHCKTEAYVEGKVIEELKTLGFDGDLTFYKGKGCKECNNIGYIGREMISEVLVVSDKISRMIAAGASKEEIQGQANKEGFITMFQDGVQKAIEGKTTLEEVYRVART